MTRRHFAAAGFVAAALVAAYLAGRAAAPTRTVETVRVERTTRTEYRERASSASSSTASTAATDNRVTTRVITRTAPGPGCEPAREVIVERTESAATTRTDAANTLTATRTVDAANSTAERLDRIRVTERVRAGWSAGLDATYPGTSLSDYRARIDRRVIGPLWIGVHAERNAIGLGARVEW